jgi:hypothetical protein
VQTSRWTATTTAMCGIAWGLHVLGTDVAQLRAAVADPQGLVDTAGPDALVLVTVSALAWLCWAWGALGLLLTAASVLPGWAGRLAGALLPGLLPAAARRAAALAIGLGLTATAPVTLPQGPTTVAVTTTSASVAAPVLTDWPRPVAGSPFDWPDAPYPSSAPPSSAPPPSAPPSSASPPSTAPPPAATPPSGTPPPAAPDWPAPQGHVVLRGDCLWDIARDHLTRQRAGAPASDAEVAAAVHAWWQANATVIGPDPDRLLPGQVLQPPR